MPATIDDSLRNVHAVAADSLASSKRALDRLSHDEGKELINNIRDSILDLAAEQLALYKVAVLAAKDAETPEQVAWIWQEATAFFQRVFEIWSSMRIMIEGLDQESQMLIDYYKNSATRLLSLSEAAYRFHAE